MNINRYINNNVDKKQNDNDNEQILSEMDEENENLYKAIDQYENERREDLDDEQISEHENNLFYEDYEPDPSDEYDENYDFYLNNMINRDPYGNNNFNNNNNNNNNNHQSKTRYPLKSKGRKIKNKKMKKSFLKKKNVQKKIKKVLVKIIKLMHDIDKH